MYICTHDIVFLMLFINLCNKNNPKRDSDIILSFLNAYDILNNTVHIIVNNVEHSSINYYYYLT